MYGVTRQQKKQIFEEASLLTNEELLQEFKATMAEVLFGCDESVMKDRGYDPAEIKNAERYFRYCKGKIFLLDKLLLKRNINAWNILYS